MKNYWFMLSFCIVTMLAGCMSVTGDLASKTYRATDNVMDQAPYVTKATPILVGTLTDVDALETSSTFGRMVAEQISARLTQHGYDVTETKMRTSLNVKDGQNSLSESGEYMLSRNLDVIKGEQKAAVVITGTYAVGGRDVLVNLKLLDVATGKVLGAIDYSVAKDANILRLTSSIGTAMSGESFYGSSMAF